MPTDKNVAQNVGQKIVDKYNDVQNDVQNEVENIEGNGIRKHCKRLSGKGIYAIGSRGSGIFPIA